MKYNSIILRKLILTALYISMGVVLPIAFHSVPNSGTVFSPMHIPVFLCGLTCGFQYGLICGISAPILSSVLTGMPPLAILPSMICELTVYGVISGLALKYIFPKKSLLSVYFSLITAMLCGRLVKGVLDALLFSSNSFTIKAFIASCFISAIPGIIIQLTVIPAAVFTYYKFTDKYRHT